MTEQKQIFLEKIDALRHLSGTMAHDLNNALMPIQAFSEFLINNPSIVDNRQEVFNILNDIHNASKDLAHMLHGLGSISRPDTESPRKNLQPSTLLKDAFEWALAFRTEQTQADSPVMTLSPRLDSIPAIRCEARLMHDALAGLMLDALEARTDDAIAIDGHLDANGIVITISTTSPKEAQESSTYRHKSFFRAADAEDMSAGLVMAYSIIRGHNGNLDIERSDNGGKTYSIRLPL